MNFEPISYFFEIIRWRSVSKAAKALNISQPALSRYLKSLEDKVGKKLYIYEEKQIFLTQDGEDFVVFLKERELLEKNFLERVHNTTSELSGTIRILTSSGVANFWLIDVISEFVKVQHDIRITVVTTDAPIQYHPDYDMTIGPELIRSDIESTFLKSYNFVLFASPSYLDYFGTPKTISDLDHHRLVAYSKQAGSPIGDVDWFLRIGTQNGLHRKPFMEVNSSVALRQAAQKGIGIVSLGREYIDQESMGLHQVLPQISPLRVELFISHLKKSHSNPVMLCFKEFIINYIKRTFPFY